MKIRVRCLLGCLAFAGLLFAASGAALAVHMGAIGGGCCDRDGDHERQHDGGSCTICQFLAGGAGKYIVATDAGPGLMPEAGEHAVIVEASRPEARGLGVHICRGPPKAA